MGKSKRKLSRKTRAFYDALQNEFDLYPGSMKEFCIVKNLNYNTVKQQIRCNNKVINKVKGVREEAFVGRIAEYEHNLGEEAAGVMINMQKKQLTQIDTINSLTEKIINIVSHMLDQQIHKMTTIIDISDPLKVPTAKQQEQLQDALSIIRSIYLSVQDGAKISSQLATATKNLATLFGGRVEMSAELRKKVQEYSDKAEGLLARYGYKMYDDGRIEYEKKEDGEEEDNE